MLDSLPEACPGFMAHTSRDVIVPKGEHASFNWIHKICVVHTVEICVVIFVHVSREIYPMHLRFILAGLAELGESDLIAVLSRSQTATVL